MDFAEEQSIILEGGYICIPPSPRVISEVGYKREVHLYTS